MTLHMFSMISKCFQIIRGIIHSIAIFMMRFFSIQKSTAHLVFKNDNMFKNITLGISPQMIWQQNFLVTLLNNISISVSQAKAYLRTKTRISSAPIKRFLAILANSIGVMSRRATKKIFVLITTKIRLFYFTLWSVHLLVAKRTRHIVWPISTACSKAYQMTSRNRATGLPKYIAFFAAKIISLFRISVQNNLPFTPGTRRIYSHVTNYNKLINMSQDMFHFELGDS